MNRPYIDALVALTKKRVDFLIVGVNGINFFARDPSVAFMTQDLDVLLRPDSANLGAALQSLASIGFKFEAGGEPFIDLDDDSVLRNVISMTSNVVAFSDEDERLDLMLALHDFPYKTLRAESVRFKLEGITIRVLALDRLLESKRRAGREKDLRFLEAFEARKREFLQPSPRRAPSKKKPRTKRTK